MASRSQIGRARAAVVVSTLAVTAVLANPSGADSQQPATGPTRLAFDAATIKPAARDAIPNRVPPASPNRLFIPSMTLVTLVYHAYGDGGFNTAMSVRGGPDWANRTAFAVEGVASGTATPRQLRLMLQTLLEERFALKFRTETQTFKALTLVVDRPDGTLGPKVKKWSGGCPPVRPVLSFEAPRRPPQNGQPSEGDDPAMPYCPTGYRTGGITVDGATMFTVAELLSLPPSRALLGTITHDRTGLTGRYAMELDYPFPPAGPGAAGAPPQFAGPSLSTAIQEQWGLRIVPGEGPLKVIVIENAVLPAQN